MSEAALVELQKLATQKGRVPNIEVLRCVDAVIDDSWRLHTVDQLPAEFLRVYREGEAMMLRGRGAFRTAGQELAAEMCNPEGDFGRLRVLIDRFRTATDEREAADESFARRLKMINCFLRPETDPAGRIRDTFFKNVICEPHLIDVLPRRARGRPAGTICHTECRLFVHHLLIVVSKAGGKLSHNKNYPERSTLMRALDLLAPYLPCSVTDNVSPGLLAEICIKWRARRREVERRSIEWRRAHPDRAKRWHPAANTMRVLAAYPTPKFCTLQDAHAGMLARLVALPLPRTAQECADHARDVLVIAFQYICAVISDTLDHSPIGVLNGAEFEDAKVTLLNLADAVGQKIRSSPT